MHFAKANSKNEARIEVLDNFCNLPRKKVSLGKSRIYFSNNVTRRRKRNMCKKMGISVTNDLGRYLGFPFLHQGKNGNAFNFVVKKIQGKLARWNTKLLSRAGRLVLVKAAVTPIADYCMQCHALPIKGCNAIDKTIRDFLWGSMEKKRKLHVINWQTVTLRKELGGLGLFQMRYRNLALLAKLYWRLANEHEAPWEKMIVAKYLSLRRLTREGKRIWAAYKKGGLMYVRGPKWTVKNGESISF
nr:putative ribonuclease h protein [Quercus suber]